MWICAVKWITRREIAADWRHKAMLLPRKQFGAAAVARMIG
jgi:hypothetical protein